MANNFSISYIYQIRDKLSPTLKKINSMVNQHNRGLGRTTKMWKQLNTMLLMAGIRIARARKEAARLKAELKDSWGELLGIGATVASIALPVREAMAFETAMMGVAKAADLERGTAQFDHMRNTIRAMAREIPKTQAEIAAMFESGARLGIGASDLPGFALLTAKTAVAFDLMADQAGDSLASISAKMGLPINQVELMMDAINAMENTTSAKGGQMIEIIGRIAGAAKSIELSPEQTAGLAAFANQITVSPELAASGLNMMISRMQKIPALHKKLLESPEKAVSGMLQQLKALDKVQRASVISKIFGDEAGRFVMAAVESLDLYQKTMSGVADKSHYAGSMTGEYNKQMQTTAAQAIIARNGLNDMMISLGNKMLPVVYKGALLVQDLAFGMAWLVDQTGPVVPMIAAFAGVLVTLRAAALAGKVAMLALNVAMAANPVGLVVAGVAALVAAIIWAYNEFEPFRNLVNTLWDGFLAGIDKVKPALGAIKDLAMTVFQAPLYAIEKIQQAWNWLANNDGGQPTAGGIPNNPYINPTLSGADAGRSLSINGSVAVDINAPHGTVKGASSSGSGVRVSTYAYGGHMQGIGR